MTTNIFGRLAPASRGNRSFYAQLRSRDEDEDYGRDIEQQEGLRIDEENLRQHLHDFDAGDLPVEDSQLTVESPPLPPNEPHRHLGKARSPSYYGRVQDEDFDNDVPASLLVEHNDGVQPSSTTAPRGHHRPHRRDHNPSMGSGPAGRNDLPWGPPIAQQVHDPHHANHPLSGGQPRSLMAGKAPVGAREKALWRWVNTSNLDSFMRDVYDYYEGGGLWCILCSNALWLLLVYFAATVLPINLS